MYLHDYIIISQNKQDNSRLCAILDYHQARSDHDERVAKVGPAMRIAELEAKSKSKRRAARFFIFRGVWRLSIIYCLLVIFDVHIRRPNASTRSLHIQPNSFSQSSCIPCPCRGRILDITPKVCCGHCYEILPHLTINTTSSNKINTTSRSGTRTISIRP